MVDPWNGPVNARTRSGPGNVSTSTWPQRSRPVREVRTVPARYGSGISLFVRLVEPAAQQRGYVTTLDAAAVGVPAVELRKMAARGWLTRTGHGIYRLRFPDRAHDDLMVAVLWTAGRGLITGTAALDLRGIPIHGIPDKDPGIHLAVPPDFRPRRAGGDRYRLIHTDLDAADVDRIDDVPTVTPALAFIHALQVGDHADGLTRALNAAKYRRLLDTAQLHHISAATRHIDYGRHPDERVFWRTAAAEPVTTT